jgi:hypothetical protein
MAEIINGPHDGERTFSAVPDQIGLVLSLSPCRVDPEPGQPGSYYRWNDGRWVFERFVDRSADWEELFWATPRRVIAEPEPNGKSFLARMTDKFFNTKG